MALSDTIACALEAGEIMRLFHALPGVVRHAPDPGEQLGNFRRAVDWPHRFRVRVETAVAAYGEAALDAALPGGVTTAALLAEIAPLERRCAAIVDDYKAGRLSLADVRSALAADEMVRDAKPPALLPLPSGYRDVWELRGL